MSHQTTLLSPGVMEGKGAYNKYAKIPAAGAALATPLLEKAVRKITLDPEDQPVVIADYGSSQGKNSLAPMRIAIRNLRERLGPDRPIAVFHIDQPSNDFNSLFEVLSSDPDRYALDEPNVFPSAIGRSFYEQVLPSESVHLAWFSYAAVWLRRIPRSFPAIFGCRPAQAPRVPRSNIRLQKIGKLSCRCGLARSGLVLASSLCSPASPMTDRQGSQNLSITRMLS